MIRGTHPPVIVVHGFWHPDHGLCLWGEDASLLDAGGLRQGPGPPPHPFAADHSALAAALAGAGLAGALPASGAISLDLSLPSTASSPASSPFLVRAGQETPPIPDRLATWRVSALQLSGPAAGRTLVAAWDVAANPTGHADRISLADDLRFLADLAKLALTQVAQGTVVPVLERNNGGFVARWSAVRIGPASAHLARLREVMPASMRAASPEQAPGDVLAGAFDTLVDAMVRLAIEASGGGFKPDSADRNERSRDANTARAWTHALTSRSERVAGDPAVLERVRTAVDGWSQPLREEPARAFRVCFRLLAPQSEPDEVGASGGVPDAWPLEFLLQATDDPTLLVPAAGVWRTRGRVLSAAGRRLEDPQERLLEDLGRAIRLFPPLAPALLSAAPTGLALATADAYAFLKEGGSALEQAGFGVLVPSWWGAPGERLGLQLHARPASAGGGPSSIGLDALCSYDWRVALGGETLTEAEFHQLARLKQPLVRVRGRWVELRSGDIDAALALIDSDASRPLTVGDVLRADAGIAARAAGLPVVSVVADGWIGELLASTNGDCARPEATPAGIAGELRPYQQRGLGWLAFLDRLRLGACLADDMGLGKTIQLLALLVSERENGPVLPGPGRRHTVGATLLVCPMSVVGNWQHEARRFAPRLRVHVHHGSDRLDGDAFVRATRVCDLVITTYDLTARDRDLLAAVEWHRVALDEAQNIKNSATRRAQALRALPAARRVALTGTPVENRLTELWSILDFLNPGLLGSQRAFREHFALPIERFGDDDRAADLRRITAPFILRRVKTDRSIIDDLPEKIEIREYCTLTREQATLYQAIVDDMMRKIDASSGIERRGLVLATMLRLKQVCNHPAHLMADGSRLEGRSGKLTRLEEVLEEALAAGEKALVFTQFTQWGLRLRPHLQDRLRCPIGFLHGAVSKRERDRMVERFQSGDGASVLLLSLKAGGTGLNLTAANHVVHYDRWWNPAVEDQASDRAFRIGQTRNVQVRKFICAGSLEERIDEMIERKKALAQRIVGAGEAWLTELSTEELKRVIALSADVGIDEEAG